MDQEDHPNIRRQKIFYSLFDQLCEDRRGVHQGKMGEQLFREEHYKDRQLVGLIDRSERAVFYDSQFKELIAIPFNAHELVHQEAEVLWRRQAADQSWREAMNVDFDWLHPRYR